MIDDPGQGTSMDRNSTYQVQQKQRTWFKTEDGCCTMVHLQYSKNIPKQRQTVAAV